MRIAESFDSTGGELSEYFISSKPTVSLMSSEREMIIIKKIIKKNTNFPLKKKYLCYFSHNPVHSSAKYS